MGKTCWRILAILFVFGMLGFTSRSVHADVPPVLINEVMSGTSKSVEFYNPSSNPVDLAGYQVKVADQSSNFMVFYTFQTGDSIAGNGYAVLHLYVGDDSPGVFYSDTVAPILWNGGGAVAVLDASVSAVDFVRFNGSLTSPPIGTTWTGATPAISSTANSLGRDNLSTDTDDGADWIEQTPSLGAQNVAQQCYFLTISKTGSGALPTAVADRSDGCSAGYYHAGEVIALTGAVPDTGWGVGGWTGSDNDGSHAATNTVTMPASAHAVSVTYLIRPLQVTLLAPADLTQTDDTTPAFSWSRVDNADLYTWEIRRLDDNSVVTKARYAAAVRCDADTCSIPSPVTLAPGEYKWHVVGLNEGVSGTWSIYHRLTIVLPGPILRSPGVDAIIYGGRPTFKWLPETGAASYRVRLLDSTDVELGNWGTAPACDLYCEFRLPFDLEDAYGDYTWQVRTVYADTQSAWSEARTFSYVQLERTWQISPADGFTTASTTPTFEWGEITGATLYLFQVRLPDDTFVANLLVSDATYCVDGGSCIWTIDDGILQPNTTYKWHVRAKNGRNFGRWTAYRTIVITE